jgi:UDP-glucose:(heptosyl)LPS alpha-1,3-glucosyltransferase
VSVIPNGVDAEQFSPDWAARDATREKLGIDAGDPVAVFVGGDWERKGLGPAIEGVGLARAWQLIVVGEGNRPGYQALSQGAGAAGRVHFVGGTNDAAPYYAAADVFLFPTAYEAFALVTLEAAASGLALLVSRVNGAEDILVADHNGWFIDRDADMIAQRLRALEDEEVREAMGSAARVQSARFSWDHVVAGYDGLYREIAHR